MAPYNLFGIVFEAIFFTKTRVRVTKLSGDSQVTLK